MALKVPFEDRIARGLVEHVATGEISSSFLSLTVYQARGLKVPVGYSSASSGTAAGAGFRVAIAESVNAGSQLLSGQDFAEQEAVWAKDASRRGPYVLIGVGPTEFFDCEAGPVRRGVDGSISSLDGFPSMRAEIARLRNRVIPPVLSAMTCALNRPDHYVGLRMLDSASIGKCADGTLVHDYAFETKIEGYSARQYSEQALSEVLNKVGRTASRLNPKAARYFSLATGEPDQLKKFLFFFLALEVQTHAVFKRIDHVAHATSLASALPSPLISTSDLMKEQVRKLSSLADRFVWCAACVWTDLKEEDIETFRRLKIARDAIAHGDASEPPAKAPQEAELLAHKILGS